MTGISVQRGAQTPLVKAVLGVMSVAAVAAAATWILHDPGTRRPMELVLQSPMGLIGLFVVSALSSATLFLPVPGMALTVLAATVANPLVVGVVAGLGQTVGELTGYFGGSSGSAIAGDRLTSSRLARWMGRWGAPTLFVLALIPNPVFDVAGLIAGALRLPVGTFLLAAGSGKVLRNVLVAWIATQGLALF